MYPIFFNLCLFLLSLFYQFIYHLCVSKYFLFANLLVRSRHFYFVSFNHAILSLCPFNYSPLLLYRFSVRSKLRHFSFSFPRREREVCCIVLTHYLMLLNSGILFTQDNCINCLYHFFIIHFAKPIFNFDLR